MTDHPQMLPPRDRDTLDEVDGAVEAPKRDTSKRAPPLTPEELAESMAVAFGTLREQFELVVSTNSASLEAAVAKLNEAIDTLNKVHEEQRAITAKLDELKKRSDFAELNGGTSHG